MENVYFEHVFAVFFRGDGDEVLSDDPLLVDGHVDKMAVAGGVALSR